MSIRNFGNIKSLLYFDFPYYAEPNDGLGDEVSSEIWERKGNTKLAGQEIPYDVEGMPKFGYRCAYFPDTSSRIFCRNDTEIFTLSPDKKYEFEAFIKKTGTEGSIFSIGSNLLTMTYTKYNGHYFKWFTDGKTWEEAQAYCEKLGGHLATSTSAEKNAFLTNLTGGIMAWIGLVDKDRNRNF